MICFDLVKKMRNVREWFNLSITEQALFYELVFVCNKNGWVDCFSCSNKRLAGTLKINERTLQRLRFRLAQCKLISYCSRRNRQQSPFYSLTKDLINQTDLPSEADLLLLSTDPGENTEEEQLPYDTGGDTTSDTTNDTTNDRNSTSESDLYKTKTKTKTNSDNERKIKEQFELFRKAYPGTKRGLDTEYKWFRQKHTDSETVTCLLLPAIEKQKRWRAQRKLLGLFVPEYPHLRTWLGQRRWEAELETHHTDSHESEPYIID